MKHELHTYLYRCDGYRPDGRECSEERRIEAFDWNDADVQISAASGIRTNKPWKFTREGMMKTSGRKADTLYGRHSLIPALGSGDAVYVTNGVLTKNPWLANGRVEPLYLGKHREGMMDVSRLRQAIRDEIDGMEVGFVESYGHTYYLADHCADDIAYRAARAITAAGLTVVEHRDER